MIVTLVAVAGLINILAKSHNYGIPTDNAYYKNIRVRRDSPDGNFQLYPINNKAQPNMDSNIKYTIKEIFKGDPYNRLKRNVGYNTAYNSYNDTAINRFYNGNNSNNNGYSTIQNINSQYNNTAINRFYNGNNGYNSNNNGYNNNNQGYNGYVDYNDTAINRFYYGDNGYISNNNGHNTQNGNNRYNNIAIDRFYNGFRNKNNQSYNGLISYNDINGFYYGNNAYKYWNNSRTDSTPYYGQNGYVNPFYRTNYTRIGYNYSNNTPIGNNHYRDTSNRQYIANNAYGYNGIQFNNNYPSNNVTKNNYNDYNQWNNTFNGTSNQFYNPFKTDAYGYSSTENSSYNGTAYSVSDTLTTTTPKIVSAFIIGHIGCPTFFKKMGIFCVPSENVDY